MKRVPGAWLLFLFLAIPDSVRMVTDRGVSPPVPAARVSGPSVAVPPAAAAGGGPAAASLPPDFAKAPFRFLSAAPPDSLELLPGIGPVLAARIADARTGKSPYTSWNDLLAVRGIGPKTVARLRALVAR